MRCRSLLLALIAASCASVAPPPSPAPQARTALAPPLDAGREATSAAAAPPITAIGVVPPLGSGMRTQPRDPADLCEPALSNLERAARAILAQPSAPPGKRTTSWDTKSEPQHLERVMERSSLTAAELERLRQQRFVVLERLEEPSYTRAFHELYRSELPLYVSVDAIFHAVFHGHDTAMAELEHELLAPELAQLLDALHEKLPAFAAELPTELASDLDLFLTVARSLQAGEHTPSALNVVDSAVRELVASIEQASGLERVPLFGRSRMVDFSRYQPRGRYAKYMGGGLGPYFRASTWLANLELNLVSRGGRSSAPGFVPDRSETPREALLALALAELVERAGGDERLARLDRAWAALGGLREDVSMAELTKLRKRAAIGALTEPDAFDRLKAAIGHDYARTTRIHYMPHGSSPLPAIATLLGPRITPDTTTLTMLVHGDVPRRYSLGAGDVGFLLGHDRARTLLAKDLGMHSNLDARLGAARAALAKVGGGDLYSSWLAAIRALADSPAGALPSYAEQPAFADLRLGSALVAYGQIRHDYVLIAAQGYDEGGCVIPDGYVDPAPGVYAALVRYAERGARFARELGRAELERYFLRLENRLSVLESIARQELSGAPLSDEAKRWLSMVVEVEPANSETAGSYDGWYFDLFYQRHDAMETPEFVSDYYASVNTRQVSHLGATLPKLALFVVDTNGPPRIVVGPVAHGFEAVVPSRIASVDQLGRRARRPWTRSYLAPASRPLPIAMRAIASEERGDVVRWTIEIDARGREARVDLLDHHRRPLASGSVARGRRRLELEVASGREVAAWRVSSGSFSHFEAMPYFYVGSHLESGGATELGDPD
jgi:hypothetical protein